jgi:hypothetical protein
MKHDRLDILAERFWNGECSEVEEQDLKELIQEGAVPAEHAELKAYLDFTSSAQEDELLGGAFDQQVMQEIDRRESTSNGYPYWMKIAAGIAIILGLFGAMQSLMDTDGITTNPDAIVMVDDTFEDPEMAYEEVKKALALMGMKMNDGLDHAGSLGKFDQATAEISNENAQASKGH